MMTLKKFVADLQLVSYVFWHHVMGSRLIIWWVGIFGGIVFTLQWLFNIEQLWNVLNNSSQSLSNKLTFLSDGFVNIFRYADDIVPVSIILIGVLQAAAISLYISMRQQVPTKNTKLKTSSLGVAIIGAGCVACGGSILTPLLGAVASGISATLAERLSDGLLILAVILSYKALSAISLAYAQQRVK